MSAALYHLHASIGSRASGASAGTRYEYLKREGIFAEKGRCAEDFVESISDNMPEWAQADPGMYWRMADLHERDKAVLFREVEFAIPHGIPEAERGQWAEVMAHAVATTKDGAHPFTLAVHAGKDGENWNAHVIVSERVNDGINRDPEKWFSRAANAKSNQPEKGGARKTREMQPTSWLLRQRKTWERIGNEALAKAGREERLDCRSYKDRGIEKIPQIHLGRKAHQMKQRGAQSDRVARYDEIEEANRLMRAEREAMADLAKTEEQILKAAADRKATAAEIRRAAEMEKLEREAKVAQAGEIEDPLAARFSESERKNAAEYVRTRLQEGADPEEVYRLCASHILGGSEAAGQYTAALIEAEQQAQQTRPLDPVEQELIDFLKEHGDLKARHYVELVLPAVAKRKETTALEEYCNTAGYNWGPGAAWEKEKACYQALMNKAVGKDGHGGMRKKLEDALVANRGFFGRQKKDTPEIFELKRSYDRLVAEITASEKRLDDYEKRWKVDRPEYQRRADQRNAETAQARRFLPFLATTGMAYVQQCEQRERAEERARRTQQREQGQARRSNYRGGRGD